MNKHVDVFSCEAQEKLNGNWAVRLHTGVHCMSYFKSAPYPPSERRTDAGRLPPWLPGVAMSGVRVLDGFRVR